MNQEYINFNIAYNYYSSTLPALLHIRVTIPNAYMGCQYPLMVSVLQM